MRILLALAPLLAIACSPSSSHPPALNGCTNHDGAANCTGGSGGGGASSGSSGGGGNDATAGDASAANCGANTSSGSLATSNQQCAPCITASCCQAGTACAESGACTALLSCNATNINACESQYPSGVTAYNDFASCLQANCSPECPTLPQATPGDL